MKNKKAWAAHVADSVKLPAGVLLGKQDWVRPWTDCVSDHEPLIVKFRLKLKKVGKSTRPFRYDLNQVPYDYIVEVTNRFKRLDLIGKLPEELWTEVHGLEKEAVIKILLKKKECKKAKWLSEEALK